MGADVPDSALILRKHGVSSNLFSCLMFNELEAFNPRDQLAFAFVRDHMTPKLKLNMFDVQVFEHVAIEYRHNLKHNVDVGITKLANTTINKSTKMTDSDFLHVNGSSGRRSSCHRYLTAMWSKSHGWCPKK